MRVMSFHLMPYAPLDVSVQKEYRSAWVVLPNSYYDPKVGHELYNRYLDELELAAELGFDGVCINEHHQTAYGLMPSPVVMASALSRRIKDAKIAILGNAFCLRDNPLTLAEEHAMIDVITGGRVISGFVRGVGSEYFSFGTNPVHSLARHKEAADLVVRAWTETGPFAFEGEHYHIPYVNLWPRPYQDPHPPIWCPSQGSSETIEWSADPSRKFTYLQTYSPRDNVSKYLDMYREIAQTKYGYEASSDQIGWCAPMYVGETDEQALAEAGEHFEMMFNVLLPKFSELMFFPPGYMSPDSLKRVLAMKKGSRGSATAEMLIEKGIVLCGSPDTVVKQITKAHNEMGFSELLCMLMFGSLPGHLAEKNIRLFAEHVLPAIKPLDDANYRGFELPKTANVAAE